ncbi:Alkaline phosphatase [Halothece sp. PCC 7418]|uniref:Alkaline phosphatase D n=1 Tax=Aphanothece halophytica TaxID=72020 RepID=F5HRA4_APHHA|nr:alkaline phosphatase D family protein [Halothece sp. PCC 7418]AFZ44148.1 Alkaline phosphatase [Halothece sp. PCC 7418]BAK26808.1 alkaline phosphatase D [Aphanothece halophytica]
MIYPFSSRMGRRNFLLTVSTIISLTLAKQASRRALAHPKFSDYPFSLGVASGDPTSDSVVLWTRLISDSVTETMPIADDLIVSWQIAADPKMRNLVSSGTTIASPELAHSVHVVVEGLSSDRAYWYQFKVGNELSPIGRTRTLPDPTVSPYALKFAFVSCQNYEQGYFNPYRHLADEDLDFVIHLGDYIYEYAANTSRGFPRQHPAVECSDLATYRQRYSLYKRDRDLQAAHAAFPFICTWDDHEVENDYANTESENFEAKQTFLQRRMAAYQAYYEHLPLRPFSRPQGASMQLYRRFQFGNLAQFYLLDGRQYRSDQAGDDNGEGGGQVIDRNCPELNNPNRSLLGKEQEQWLFQALKTSETHWNVIAQPYLVSQLKQPSAEAVRVWTDGWDGYPVSRQRLLEFLHWEKIANPIFIGGDIHSFWVSDLKRDFDNPESEIVASEFVTSSISSLGVPYEQFLSYLSVNPHIKFFESRQRGYVKCTCNQQQWTSELKCVDTVETPQSQINTLASYWVENGKKGTQLSP